VLQKRAVSALSKLCSALAAVALVLVLLVPAALSDSVEVLWTSPTPVDRSRITVSVGSPITFTLTASASDAQAVVHIEAVDAPTDAVFNSSDGGAARASFDWTPRTPGNYTIQFEASVPGVSVASRTYVVHVKPAVRYPRSYVLSGEKVARWATVWKRAAVRSEPSSSARVVTMLETRTTDDTQNIVVVLNGVEISPTETWYRIRLAILPNNSTGWVQGENLGRLFTVHTHLYVDRAKLTATLKRDGVTIFGTHVGVGRSVSPTPRGEFYIRDKLTKFDDPSYGPVAFGTSARSAVLTDWPDGGVVGIHGGAEPQILPGRVSHGCNHMRNAALLKLARLMPVGTPLTIR
jgi:hypothetical protein